MQTRRIRQFSVLALSTALAAAIAACGGGSSNSSSGDPTPGARADVTIKRDDYGVAHVFADSVYGLYYGYGYALATDRLYQMDMARRIGNGTVAEVLGPDYIGLDRSTVSNFDPAAIRQQMAQLSQADRDLFDGYAAGFNARIREVLADRQALLPKGYVDNGFEPTPWMAEDVVMVWVGLILNRFFAGTQEVANLELLTQLQQAQGDATGEQLFRQLRWLEDPTAPTIVPRANTHTLAQAATPTPLRGISSAAAQRHHATQVALMGEEAAAAKPTASNAWLVAPARSQSGHATLFNGPQQGFYTPSFLYTIGLHGAGYNVTGSASVGLPAIFFGTNGDIAWGSTVGALDTNDTYQEILNPANPYEYWYQGSYRQMEKRTVNIAVKGAEPVAVDVYATVHGYIKAWDLDQHRAYTHRRSWEGHEVESLLGWTQAAQAKNWDEFLAQGQRVGASITWFYADRQGNIGAVGLGYMPDRPETQDIQLPAVGDGSMEWRGRQPFSANPRAYNPAQGYLTSWNNQIAAGLRADSANYSYVDRVQELITVIDASPQLSFDDIWALNRHGAFADINARYFAHDLVDAAADMTSDPLVSQAAALVAAWDWSAVDSNADGRYDAPGLTIYRTWLAHLYQQVFAGQLPSAVLNAHAGLGYPTAMSGSASPGRAVKLLWNALSPQSGVPQTYDFLQGRDPKSLMQAALLATVSQLRQAQGEDPSQWLTAVTPMTFDTANSGAPWAPAGSGFEAPVYMNRGTKNFSVVMAPDGATMCSVVAPGQSGFIAPDGTLGAHSDDQWQLYLDFGCKPEHLDGDVHASVQVLRIE